MKSPVLLLWFNRPELSQQQWDHIKNYANDVYIAIDGPRAQKPDDRHKVELCRNLAQSVTSSSRLLIRENNLGCGRAVDSAITWFFEHVEKGIILEDDIFPNKDFFSFADELLNYYEHDNRIMCICGDASPITDNIDFGDYSYAFSRYPLIWGWATWRRAWIKYDRQLKIWPEIKRRGDLIGLFNHEDQYHVFFDMCEKIYQNKIPDIWDYQWLATMFFEHGLAIIPRVNLVHNKGFGSEGTHTNNQLDPRSKASVGKMTFPLVHPKTIHSFWKIEKDILRYGIGVRKKPAFKRFIKRILKIPRDRIPFSERW